MTSASDVTLTENMRGKWIVISAAAVLVGIGVGAFSLRHSATPADAPAPSTGAAVSSANLVTLSGRIRPQHLTSVPAPASGDIEIFMADVGQDVFEGQELARIGATGLASARDAAATVLEQAQEQVSRAEAAVGAAIEEASRAEANAQRSRTALERVDKVLSRQRTLFNAGATPRLTYEKTVKEYESAQADFEVMDKAARAARAQVDLAREQLASAKQALEERGRQLDQAKEDLDAADVRAPVEGVVVARNGEVGKPAAGSLFEIATDLYALEVPLDAPAAARNRIRAGQPAAVMLPDLGGTALAGSVKSVDGSLVVVEFTNTMPAVRPGMLADVRLKLD